MKKLIIIVLALLLLSGCGGQPTVTEAPPSAESTATDAPVSAPLGETPDAAKTPEPTGSQKKAADTEKPTRETPSTPPTQPPSPSLLPSVPPTPVPTPAPTPEPTPEPEPTHNTQYNTDIVPEGKPEPVEPQDVTLGSLVYTCTLSVRCDTILNNMDLLATEKHDLVPEDGIIFTGQTVTFYEGESVFNVLQREMKRAKIHMEFVNTPIYNSAYIEGIGNLYEFDVGERSGWMYKVNGWFPNYGCSRYQLSDGDVIEWVYTCDLGSDVGGGNAVGG